MIEEWDEEDVIWKNTSLTLDVTRHSFGYLAVPESVICDFRSTTTTEELDSTTTEPVTGKFVKKNNVKSHQEYSNLVLFQMNLKDGNLMKIKN